MSITSPLLYPSLLCYSSLAPAARPLTAYLITSPISYGNSYIMNQKSTLNRITYLGHATLLIEIDGVRILTDPLLRNRVGFLQRQGTPIESIWHPRVHKKLDIDAVLISHLHWDHLDLPSLRLLDPTTHLIVPRGGARLLSALGFEQISEVGLHERLQVGPIEVQATYAEHDGARLPFMEGADCLGFLLRGRQQIYFAGDTDLFAEMATLSDNLDVALLPVWGWGPTLGEGHLDPYRAAQALSLLRPRLAIPIHWGTFLPFGVGLLKPDFLTQPPHTFKRHALDLAPEVGVHIVQPGEGLTLLGEHF